MPIEVVEVNLSGKLQNVPDKERLNAMLAQHLNQFRPMTMSTVTLLVLCVIILLLIAVLNGVVLYYTLRYRNLRRRVSSLMISLASSDLLVGLICIPVNAAHNLLLKYWIFGIQGCKILRSVDGYVMTINSLTLISMATIRLRQSLTQARGGGELSDKCLLAWVACIWVASAILCSPIPFIYTVTEIRLILPSLEDENSTVTKVYYHCHESKHLISSHMYRYLYHLATPLMHSVIPAVFIACCYFRIAMVIASRGSRRSGHRQQEVSLALRPSHLHQHHLPHLPHRSSEQASSHHVASRCRGNNSLLRHHAVHSGSGGGGSSGGGSGGGADDAESNGGLSQQVLRIHKRAISTVVALVTSFVVCTMPKHALVLALDFLPSTRKSPASSVINEMLPFFQLLMYLHSVASPVLYWYYNTTFRRYIRYSLAGFCRD